MFIFIDKLNISVKCKRVNSGIMLSLCDTAKLGLREIDRLYFTNVKDDKILLNKQRWHSIGFCLLYVGLLCLVQKHPLVGKIDFYFDRRAPWRGRPSWVEKAKLVGAKGRCMVEPNKWVSFSLLLWNHLWIKGTVHFEINFWYVLAYLKGIQDVGVFVSTAFSILTFFCQTGVVCQSYNGILGGPPQRAYTEKS